ncbi:hypothetical protein [Sphingomonas sp. Leaf4]|uniref:hypothetical protein n=1 Tax=Sphingomonas sp. Leaf4 TaxID=2876553 RepID=UPI001E468D26|nr:hypothetical protein [Sphingomonas sp. Leaf4]
MRQGPHDRTDPRSAGLTIIGGVLLLTAPWVAVTLHRRQRRKLRQWGIKRYGH